jgi:hypothetical protein
MRKILLFIAASFVFFSAMAQITQYESDSIVLQRMSTETRQYTLFAQKNLYIYNELSLRTSVGEILELNCSCWVYYICYVEETDKHDCRYLIVNDSNGNLLEVKTRNDLIPDDLDTWRGIELIEIPITDYSLRFGCDWDYLNIKKDSLYLINSEEELMTLISCSEGSIPFEIDFDRYSLLFAFGTTTMSIAKVIKNLQQLSLNKYSLNTEVYLSWKTCAEAWIVAIITDKLNEKNKIKLNITIKK